MLSWLFHLIVHCAAAEDIKCWLLRCWAIHVKCRLSLLDLLLTTKWIKRNRNHRYCLTLIINLKDIKLSTFTSKLHLWLSCNLGWCCKLTKGTEWWLILLYVWLSYKWGLCKTTKATKRRLRLLYLRLSLSLNRGGCKTTEASKRCLRLWILIKLSYVLLTRDLLLLDRDWCRWNTRKNIEKWIYQSNWLLNHLLLDRRWRNLLL